MLSLEVSLRHFIIAGVVLALGSTAASAQSMNAEEFHRRATALQKKGPLALMQRGEIKALMTEGQAAGKVARERRLAAVRAGRPAPYCPPSGEVRMDSSDFMRRLGAIPTAERRRMNMSEATLRVLASKFPCRG